MSESGINVVDREPMCVIEHANGIIETRNTGEWRPAIDEHLQLPQCVHGFESDEL
jgi:hypothetical protein